MSIEIHVPQLGESITEATIGKWFKKIGEYVRADEPIVELETDKVTVEVPTPKEGIIEKIVVQTGDTVEIGALLATLGEGTQEQQNEQNTITKRQTPQTQTKKHTAKHG